MSVFYNYNKLLSYNAMFNFIIGERGVGKSYGAKKFVVNKFLKTGKQFVYVRRYKTELKNALKKDKQPIFFDQISNEFPNTKFSNNSNTFSINGKVAGYSIALSTANIQKSATFEKVETIIFDEFIIDKGSYHYLQNEVEQMLDLVETVARLRDIRVLFLGNAISITNPYFSYFNLSLPYNSEFKTFNNGTILVNYIKNEPYRNLKKQSRFGELIKNTEYGRYAIDNEFLRDSKAFIKKKPKDSKFYFTMLINNKYYGVWTSYKEQGLFISKDYNPTCNIIFTIDSNSHNEDTIFIKGSKSVFFQSVITSYRMAKLFFESQQIKNNVIEYIKKYLTF